MSGKIQLPKLLPPPDKLYEFFFGGTAVSKHFLANIRSYNNMFCFTSMGGKVDASMNTGRSPPIFTVHGQNHHRIGSLLPVEGTTPRFVQLYIYDTDNEVENRMKSVRGESETNDLHQQIVDELRYMFDRVNVLVKHFRMARDKISDEGCGKVTLGLLRPRTKDGLG